MSSSKITQSSVPGYQRTLSMRHVTLLVIAAAAPLSSMIGNVPSGIILGNGAGIPAMFLLAGILMAILVFVYLNLHRLIPDAGGFVGYIRVGLGEGISVGAAYATTLCYAAATIAYSVGVGYFGSLILEGFGLKVPWWVITFVAFAIMGLLGRRAADVSGRTVMVLVAAEFVLLVIFDVAVIAKQGLGAFPVSSFSPRTLASGHIGPALMTGLTSFIGVESGILYDRETKNPNTTIPRAIYAAVILVTVFYVVTSWIIVGGAGAGKIVAMATASQGNTVFDIAQQYGGLALVLPMQFFFVTSILASGISMHNAASRYLGDLAKAGYLPTSLGKLNMKHHVPSRASDALTAVGAIVVIVLAISGVDPYIGISTSMVGFLTIGLFGVQLIVMISTIRYFKSIIDIHRGRVLACAIIGGVGLFVVVVLMAMNYSVLTSSNSPWANLPPLILIVALCIGPVMSKHKRKGIEIEQETTVVAE